MYSKDMLIGILLAKGNFTSLLQRNDTSKIGYKVLLNIYLRGDVEFLRIVQRSLHTIGIKSTIENTNRLKISSTRVHKLLDMIPELLPNNKNNLQEYREICLAVKNKQHLTLEGLEKIMQIKGLIENGTNNNE